MRVPFSMPLAPMPAPQPAGPARAGPVVPRAAVADQGRAEDRVDLSAKAKDALGEPLSEAEQDQIAELKKRDQEVRRHEEAHQRVGGQYASAPSYEYQKGPDGRNYAVGGQVQIDTSPVPGDPDATIAKMEVVKRAALAPAEPSGQDRAVAAQADAAAQQARQEKREMERETAQGGDPALTIKAGAPRTADSGYARPAAPSAGGLLSIIA